MNNTVNKKDTLEKLLNGVNTLANVVKTTTGSKGHTMLIEKIVVNPENPQDKKKIPYITKDGITIARDIHCKDPIEEMGCDLVRQVSELTADMAGDGSSGCIVMAQKLIQNIVKLDVKDHRQLFKDIEETTAWIQQQLIKNKKKVKSLKDCIRIATISTNDVELGKLVGTVMWDARRESKCNPCRRSCKGCSV